MKVVDDGLGRERLAEVQKFPAREADPCKLQIPFFT